MVQEYYTEQRLLYITTDRLTNQTEQLVVNQPTPEGAIVNDLTLGEYAVVVTNQPERDTFEETQFDQAVRLRVEAGVQIPDKYIIQSSRLKDKAEIIKALDGDQNSPEAQAAARLKQRASEAEVTKLEAEALQKQSDAQLKAAKSQKELASIGQDTGQDEMAMEQYKLEAEMAMEQQKMEQEHQLAREKMEMEFALKREQMQAELALKREQAAAEAALKQQQAREQAMAQRVAAVEQARNTPKTTEGA
ncbi:MAG: hypothetical protein BWY87_01701 [Deltaproteobacteria bacterium ADurb.Bin510]|nr:MAG: hypothetical protein BWY87_01701 [Deltaproteobacteria bacterium ADurb.Bin510]